jgi:elongation factor 1-beta
MGIMGVKIKIMPSSLESNLEEIKKEIKKIVESNNGQNRNYSEESIAFGLKSIIAFFEIPEEQELEPIEKEIENIKEVNSIEIIDMRKID